MWILLQTYVQDLMRGEAKNLYRQLVLEGGHFYVCGDVTMAEHVLQTLKMIVQSEANMTSEQVENYMLTLRVRAIFFLFFNNVKQKYVIIGL